MLHGMSQCLHAHLGVLREIVCQHEQHEVGRFTTYREVSVAVADLPAVSKTSVKNSRFARYTFPTAH